MTACVIMHNMIVEDERVNSIFDQGFDYQGENIEPLHQDPATFEQFVQFHREMRDWHTHVNLQNDLVEHVWDHVGTNRCICPFYVQSRQFRFGCKTILLKTISIGL